MVWDYFHYANLARKGLISFKNGRITVTGLRVFLVDVDSLQGLSDRLKEKFGEETGAKAVYDAGRGAGSRATRAHRRFSKKSGEEQARYMAKMASGAGWGRIRVLDASPDGEIVVDDSPFRRRGAGRPSCDFLRGFLAGAASYIYRRRIDCVETECVSAGSKKCRFVLGSKRALLRNAKLRKYRSQLVSQPPSRGGTK